MHTKETIDKKPISETTHSESSNDNFSWQNSDSLNSKMMFLEHFACGLDCTFLPTGVCSNVVRFAMKAALFPPILPYNPNSPWSSSTASHLDYSTVGTLHMESYDFAASRWLVMPKNERELTNIFGKLLLS